jgi:hypothetical protein
MSCRLYCPRRLRSHCSKFAFKSAAYHRRMGQSTPIHAAAEPGTLLRLLYSSQATHKLGNLYLFLLLSRAREANERAGITGHLVYDDGKFVQCIEGPQHAVDALWAKIQQDERHHSIALLQRSEVQHRQFPQWSMAFSSHASFSNYDMPGFYPILESESETLVKRCRA